MATEASGWQWLPFRDTEQPMAAVTSATGVQTADTVNRYGRTRPLFAAPATVAGVSTMAVSTGRLLYQKDHYSPADGPVRAVWSQPFGNTLTTEKQLTVHESAAVRASGARTAVQRAHGAGEVLLYDGTTRTATVPVANGARLSTLSGSYALIGQQVFDIAGPRVDTGPVVALFGSLIVERSPNGATVVRDVASPQASPVTLDLPVEAGPHLPRRWLAVVGRLAGGALPAGRRFRPACAEPARRPDLRCPGRPAGDGAG